MVENKEAAVLTPENPAADHKDYDLPGGVKIAFQKGAMSLGRNGCTTGEILDVLLDHLRGFQTGKFACRENALAITKIEEAKHWIEHRANLRTQQGVKGRDAIHASPGG